MAHIGALISAGVLGIDFLLRIIGALYKIVLYSKEVDSNAYTSLQNYLFSFYGVVDAFGALSIFFVMQLPQFADMFVFLSIVILLKLARYSPALVILKDVFINERKTLFAALYVMFILTLITSVAIYFTERHSNSGFASLPDAIWWAVITLSTVGYGDVVPHTYLGKLLGIIAAISGFGMFALPAGILANGFAKELTRLKESVSWDIVANVPFFAMLSEEEIFEIANKLRLRLFHKGDIVIKEGEIGDAMYFILSGSVRVLRDNVRVVLKKGDFFGEIALIKNIPRTATVVANEKCELLELNKYDFRMLIHQKPELYKKIKEAMEARL